MSVWSCLGWNDEICMDVKPKANDEVKNRHNVGILGCFIVLDFCCNCY